MAGIQETRWFGLHCIQVGGRPLPVGDVTGHRSEGVGILLDGVATEVWKQAGEM